MNREEEMFLTNIIKSTIIGEKRLGDKLKERCIDYIEGLQQRIEIAIEILEKTDYEYSSRTELFNIISEVTETLGGKK